jgi:hypothetical protein
MKYRKLRIAISPVCGVVCLLLVALWIRSYFWQDGAIGPITGSKTLVLGSYLGRLNARVDDSAQHRSSTFCPAR